MDRVICIPSIVLGVVLIVMYLVRCKREKRSPNVGVTVSLILSASGITCGVFLVGGSLFESLMRYVSGMNLYIFIAGIALLFVSGQNVYRDIMMEKREASRVMDSREQ
jgi:hypothetical protein